MKHWIDIHPSGAAGRSGDFAAVMRLGPHRTAVVVGDIAGRGDIAGQAADALRAHVCAQVSRCITLAELLYMTFARFEQTILTDATPFASLFVAVLDDFQGVLRYASAGHEPGILFDGAGRHRHLEPTGPVLGIPTNPLFLERELPFASGDVLVVVTDGITEARCTTEGSLRFFGSAGVVRAVRVASACAQDPSRAIYRAASSHSDDKLIDDATAVVVSLTDAHFGAGEPRL